MNQRPAKGEYISNIVPRGTIDKNDYGSLIFEKGTFISVFLKHETDKFQFIFRTIKTECIMSLHDPIIHEDIYIMDYPVMLGGLSTTMTTKGIVTTVDDNFICFTKRNKDSKEVLLCAIPLRAKESFSYTIQDGDLIIDAPFL